jgi:hypothetical protein
MAAVLALWLTSCLPSQWEYLVQASGRAMQSEVKERLGAPRTTRDLEDGGSVWTYRYESSGSWIGQRGDMVGGTRCIEYVLTFDGKGVLGHWVRQPCGMYQGGTVLENTGRLGYSEPVLIIQKGG